MKLIVTLATLLFGILAFAQDNAGQVSAEIPTAPSMSANNPQGFMPIVGFGAGYMNKHNHLNTEGTPIALKILGSYYLESPMVLEAGLGYQHHNLYRFSGRRDVISTALFEASPRLRLPYRFQAGPVWNTWFNNGINYGSVDREVSNFAGFIVAKDVTVNESILGRLGAQWMFDVTVPNANLQVIMLNLQLGFPTVKAAKSSTTPMAASAATEITPAPAIQQTRLELAALKLKNRVIQFPVNKAALAKRDQEFMNKLGSVLAANAGLFESVEVVGHADVTGNDQKNQNLSSERAKNVMSYLTQSGLNPQVVKAVAKGSTEPAMEGLDSDALSANRRVELNFTGVKDTEALNKLIEQVTAQ